MVSEGLMNVKLVLMLYHGMIRASKVVAEPGLIDLLWFHFVLFYYVDFVDVIV